MFEMYVQTDVYTANKDGVSVFISTAGTWESFASTWGWGQGWRWGQLAHGTWTNVRPRRGAVYVPWTWLRAWDVPKKRAHPRET